ncbi:sensor histidine kinase [Streptomyces zagrosensis]|uniref:histidine kinase n=1 Tax=Streptomyces zagrosensis TaxID=1042984 RepID=A0A7W9UW26_9ACTN|nr:sensor domain-containing protein [Streptomyces zagrosensis]MBB5933348.1 signal transduction histidine kinase [Streptomyces zagrosensis]
MRVRNALRTTAQGFALAFITLTGSITLFVLTVLSIAFIMLGVGLITTPLVLSAVRGFANFRRLKAAEWAGITIPVPYRPFPSDMRTGFTGQVERCTLLLKDPATWRDLLWMFTDMIAGYVTALLSFIFIPYAIYGWVLAAGVWRPIVHNGGNEWYAFIPISSQFTANLAALLGLVFLVVSLYVSPLMLRGHFLLCRSLLAPTPQMALTARVERLTTTRHDAVDNSAAELRRIERDLHDGAQARLVAMGMSLGTIEALIEKDPQQAKKMLSMARANSAEALSELRDLVRGIHPPVLAERGLGDAVRALALRMPMPVETDVDLPGRFEEPVEAAAYFAVSEVLTNAAKHAEAERVWLDVHYAAGMLRIAVTDNGLGGVDTTLGSGLAGIERRLGAFDGLLAVNSPIGGPTMVTLEIPCEPYPARPTMR